MNCKIVRTYSEIVRFLEKNANYFLDFLNILKINPIRSILFFKRKRSFQPYRKIRSTDAEHRNFRSVLFILLSVIENKHGGASDGEGRGGSSRSESGAYFYVIISGYERWGIDHFWGQIFSGFSVARWSGDTSFELEFSPGKALSPPALSFRCGDAYWLRMSDAISFAPHWLRTFLRL